MTKKLPKKKAKVPKSKKRRFPAAKSGKENFIHPDPASY